MQRDHDAVPDPGPDAGPDPGRSDPDDATGTGLSRRALLVACATSPRPPARGARYFETVSRVAGLGPSLG